MDMMALRRKVIEASKRLLPAGYTQVEYLESNGTGFIKTGLNLFTGIGFEITYYAKSTIGQSGYGCIFGGRKASSDNDFQLTTYMAQSHSDWKGTFRYGGGSSERNAGITVAKKETASLRNAVYTRPDGTISNITNYTFTAGKEIYLFLLNNNGYATQGGSGCRIYDMKIYDANDQMIRHYIPCYRNSDFVPGMYETVNKEFKTNAASSGLTIPTINENLLDPAYRDDTYSSQNIYYYRNSGLMLEPNTYTLSCSESCTGLYVNEGSSSIFTKYNSTFLTFTLTESKSVWFDFYKTDIDKTALCKLEVGSSSTL